jgi:hypothetical protein
VATTPKGLPYPLPADSPPDVPAWMESLATKLDSDFLTRTDASAAYVPTGAVKASVFTFESTTATTYSDLATIGPTASVIVPPSGLVRVELQAWIRNTSVGEPAYMAYAMSGAVTQAALDDQAAAWEMASSEYLTLSTTVLTDPLPPGQTLTVTAKYRVAAGGGFFGRRRLILTPQ